MDKFLEEEKKCFQEVGMCVLSLRELIDLLDDLDTVEKLIKMNLSLIQTAKTLHDLVLNYKGPGDPSSLLILVLFESIRRQMNEVLIFLAEIPV